MKSALRTGVLATLATIFVLQLAATAHADAVTIRDPAFDLPHVCGDTDLSAARQQGYEAARDRVGQFLLVMSVARGTLHHALGNLGVDIEDDIVTRRTGYSHSEYQKMFEAMPADAQAILNAYCDGVNNAIDDMLKLVPVIPTAFELKFFRANSGINNIFGNQKELTAGEGVDPDYFAGAGGIPEHPTYKKGGFQFTPELALAFAVLQIRNFGFEGWDETGMADALDKLVDTYGNTTGTELWDDRYWMNDPLSPVSVPDPRNPGFGGPLAKLSTNQAIEVVDAAAHLEDTVRGRTRLPGYPLRDYAKVLEPIRMAQAHREQVARKWGAWPALGSYGMTISPARSATGNPWVGGFPQTGIQVPSIMHYTEVRGDTMKGNGMAFVGGPYVLIGHTDNVAYTTTTAHLKVIDTYIEKLVGGDFNLFKYDAHGTTKDMVKRIEKVYIPTGSSVGVPVFRTAQTCSVNGCNGGTRAVLAFSGEFAGVVDSATSTSTTDTSVALTPGALVGGHIAIVDGPGAGQVRAISGNTADTITVTTPWTTTIASVSGVQPTAASQWVAVTSAEDITAVAMGTSIFMEEAEAANGFSRYQKADNVMDIRDALRFIPSTHNFLAADNKPYNGVGTDQGTGNIYYGTSGFHYVRQANELDARLPVDGSGPEPFSVVSGVVGSAAAGSLTDTGAFTGDNFSSSAVNFTYDNPDNTGLEYVVQITAGDAVAQTRRISSNSDDTLTLEHPWGKIPTVGDTYTVYQIWATPEAMNPSEGFTANWNNKQSRATDAMLSENGRNHRIEMILEQLSLDPAIDRTDMRNLNKFVAGVTDPGLPGRYLLGRLSAALSAHGDCGTIDDELIANNGFPGGRGREFTNPLIVPPAGTPVSSSAADKSADFIKGWATDLASDIYGDEYGPAAVSNLTGDAAIGWILHAIDSTEGDVTGSYGQVYTGDYFNGADWKQVVHDSFCTYAAAHASCVNDNAVLCSNDTQCDFGVCNGLNVCAGDALRSCTANADCNVGPCTVGTKNRNMSNYNHPLAALPCTNGCTTPIEFDPTPFGNRGTWEQIVEVGSTVKGEFVFPMGESGYNAGIENPLGGDYMKQGYHTSSLQPLWRDYRFVPMLDVCQDVTFGGDEDGDTDGDGVVDGFERWYYGNLTNNGTSDTDGDGASLATEWRWGSDPTVADTDEDGTPDGDDVAPQDRLCVKGTLKKLSLNDSSDPDKDKVSAKWSVPLSVCIGGDYETACTTNADCGVIGRCRRIHLKPSVDSVRIVAADDTPALDTAIPVSGALWTNKSDLKFSYKDKDGVNGPVSKIKVTINEKKNVIDLSFSAKKMNVATPVDGSTGVVGMSIGTRCFMEVPTNCKTGPGKLSCSAP